MVIVYDTKAYIVPMIRKDAERLTRKVLKILATTSVHAAEYQGRKVPLNKPMRGDEN